MKNLKEFMKLRDKDNAFAITKRVHAVGIPMLLIDAVVHLNITDELIETLR